MELASSVTSPRRFYKGLPSETIPCPLCAGEDFVVLARRDRYGMGLTTSACVRCGFVLTNPRPRPEAMETFYATIYRRLYRGSAAPSAKQLQALGVHERAHYIAEWLEAGDLVHGKRVLDVGCGDGSLLAELDARGAASVVGVEPNAEYRAYASLKAGINVAKSIEDLDPSNRFDLVIANHVLEHIPDPLAFLREVRHLVDTHGHAYINVPDATAYSSIDALHIAHLSHFTIVTLQRALRGAGLEPVLVAQHEPPHHPVSVHALARRRRAIDHRTIPDRQVMRRIRRIGRRSRIARFSPPNIVAALSQRRRLHQ